MAPAAPESSDGDGDTRIGSVVDKYTIVRLLGKGGMGAVYEARHAKLSRRFAIKFLLPELASKREILRRFENEAKAAGGLEHANLAAVTDFGQATDGSPYLVMEFLQGEDCSKLLRRVGPLPIPRATDIVVQACRGLAVAHAAGIFHRDLKPENLFLADAGDGSDLVKVLDFGIAKLRTSEGSLATGTGATFGTAHYMSPEQARGASDVDQRADVWSLGVVLYELLSGRTPFEGDQFLNVIHQILTFEPPPLVSLRKGVPPKLVEAIQKAMAKDVRYRYSTVVALAQALTPFTGRTPVAGAIAAPKMPRTLPTPPTGLPKRHREAKPSGTRAVVMRVGAIGLGVAAAMIVGVLVLRTNKTSERTTTPTSRSVVSPVPPPTTRLEATPTPPPAKQPAPKVILLPPPQPAAPLPVAASAPHVNAPVVNKTKVKKPKPEPLPAARTPASQWVDPFSGEGAGAPANPVTRTPDQNAKPAAKPKRRLIEDL